MRENEVRLQIHRKAEGLDFVIDSRRGKVPASLAFSDQEYALVARLVNDALGGRFLTSRSADQISVADIPNLGGQMALWEIASEIIPIPIQRELRKLSARNVEISLETNFLEYPWEMLEIPSFHCPICQKEIEQPPVCPNCQRIKFPGLKRHAETCSCGHPPLDFSQPIKLPCKHEVQPAHFALKSAVHLGLNFGIDRHLPEPEIPRFQPEPPSAEIRPLKVLLIENPGDLYYTDRELRALRDFFSKNQHAIKANVLEKENATQTTIQRQLKQEGPFDIVHFIGHAVFDHDDPERSYLSLFGNKRLELKDVAAIFGEHAPRVVILNGCQTALVGHAEDRMVGFPTTFLELGTQTFIGTLSRVADTQACYLILYLYHEIIQGTSLTEALLHAKRKTYQRDYADSGLSDQTRHSTGFLFSWSSYVIYGDGQFRPSRFAGDLTWRGMLHAARKNLVRQVELYYPNLQDQTVPILKIPQDFFQDGEKPVYGALNATSHSLVKTFNQRQVEGRDIVCFVDVTRLNDFTSLDDHIGKRLLSLERPLSEVLPYIRQMTTEEEKFIIVLGGLDRTAELSQIISEVEDLAHRSKGAVRFVLSGNANTWAMINALASQRFLNSVHNRKMILSETSGSILAHLHQWADAFSGKELRLITADKWNPDGERFYVPRAQIETEIHQFLTRRDMTSRGFCVLGETGRGKTNLLCRLYHNEAKQEDPDRERIFLFTTARGILEATGPEIKITDFLRDGLQQSILQDHNLQYNAALSDEEITRVYMEETGGKPLELVLIIDAVNELPEENFSQFIEAVQELLDTFKTSPDFSRSIFLSLIVSSRTFSWQTYWNSKEIEHHRYFNNLGLDEKGEIEENLFDFDLETEAREAYIRTGLKPVWEDLDEEFQEVCRTPFLLHILRSLSENLGQTRIKGDYFEIMRHYEEMILLRRKTDWASLQLSGLRTAILDKIVEHLAWGDSGREGRYLPEEVNFSTLVDSIDNYPTEQVHNTIRDFRDLSVLESRGERIRYAFDRLFDYRFRNHLIARFETWQGDRKEEWARVINRFHRSEYHRHGVSGALAYDFSSTRSVQENADLALYLLELSQGELPSYRQLILEALVSFGEKYPRQLSELLLALMPGGIDSLTITTISCQVLGSHKVRRDDKQYLVLILEKVLTKFLRQQRNIEQKTLRRNLVNTIGGLGKAEEGPLILIDVVRKLIGIEYEVRELPANLSGAFTLFLNPDFQSALGQLRAKTLRHFREDDDRIRLIFKISRAALMTPQLFITLAKNLQWVPTLLTLGDTLWRIEIILEIVIKGIFLWFAERKSQNDLEFEKTVQTVDEFLFNEMLTQITEFFRNPNVPDREKTATVENLSFFAVSFGIWPEINRLFSYSERGLDYLTILIQEGQAESLTELLGLFDIDTSLSSIENARDRVFDLYLQPDAFRNYLGMLATIVQGTRDFDQVEDLLWDLFHYRSDTVIRYKSREIPQHIKISREVFSIFTYMLKRTSTNHPTQLPNLIQFVERLTESFFNFDPQSEKSTSYLDHFLNTELFGKEDPYNPLLPLGVAANLGGHPRIALGDDPDYITSLIERLVQSKLPTRRRLIRRVLYELIPTAYFAPLPVVGTLKNLLSNKVAVIYDEPEIKEYLVEVIKNLNLIISGHLTKMFDFLGKYAEQLTEKDRQAGRNYAQLISEIQTDALGSSLRMEEIEYLYRSIDVFGGHDLVTSLLLEFDYIRKQVMMPYLHRTLSQVSTASEMFQGIIGEIIMTLFSEETGFSLVGFLFKKDDPEPNA